MIRYAQGEKINFVKTSFLTREYKKITRHYKWKGRYVKWQWQGIKEVLKDDGEAFESDVKAWRRRGVKKGKGKALKALERRKRAMWASEGRRRGVEMRLVC